MVVYFIMAIDLQLFSLHYEFNDKKRQSEQAELEKIIIIISLYYDNIALPSDGW